MRICPNCGHMLSDKDTICFKCGMQLSQISNQNPMMNMSNNRNGFSTQTQQPMMGMNNNFTPNNNNNRFINNNNNKKNSNNTNNQKQDNSKLIYAVLGIVILLAVIAVVIVLVVKNSESSESDSSGNEITLSDPDTSGGSKETNPEDPGTEEPEEPENPENPEDPEDPEEPEEPSGGTTGGTHTGTLVVPDGYHEVSNNGYSYAIPDEYTSKDYETKGFDILNYQKTKEMLISISLGSVSNLKNSLPAVKQMYIDSGAVVHNIKTATISDTEVICVELTKNNQNMIIGITDAAEGEIFVVAVYAAKTNEFDYDLLEEGISFTKTAVKTTTATIKSTGA